MPALQNEAAAAIAAAEIPAPVTGSAEKQYSVVQGDALAYYDLPEGNGGQDISAEDLRTLRRVSGKITWIAFTIAFVELCERFSYYGTTVVCGLVIVLEDMDSHLV